jgi:hypothetical protein
MPVPVPSCVGGRRVQGAVRYHSADPSAILSSLVQPILSCPRQSRLMTMMLLVSHLLLSPVFLSEFSPDSSQQVDTNYLPLPPPYMLIQELSQLRERVREQDQDAFSSGYPKESKEEYVRARRWVGVLGGV